MKHLLPSRAEAVCFAALAVVCGILVRSMPAADVALASIAIPVFIFAGVLGMRRNSALQEADDAGYDEPRDFDGAN